MSVMSSLLLFLLCITVYASNARRLGIMDKESSPQVHLPGQDSERAIVDKPSFPFKVKQEVQRRGQGLAGAKTQKLKDTKALSKGVEESAGTTISGTEIIVHSSDVGLRQATKIEGSERRVRLLIGLPFHDSQEIVDSKENDIKEDIVFMDYQQPHRKPPIHNPSSP